MSKDKTWENFGRKCSLQVSKAGDDNWPNHPGHSRQRSSPGAHSPSGARLSCPCNLAEAGHHHAAKPARAAARSVPEAASAFQHPAADGSGHSNSSPGTESFVSAAATDGHHLSLLGRPASASSATAAAAVGQHRDAAAQHQPAVGTAAHVGRDATAPVISVQPFAFAVAVVSGSTQLCPDTGRVSKRLCRKRFSRCTCSPPSRRGGQAAAASNDEAAKSSENSDSGLCRQFDLVMKTEY